MSVCAQPNISYHANKTTFKYVYVSVQIYAKEIDKYLCKIKANEQQFKKTINQNYTKYTAWILTLATYQV